VELNNRDYVARALELTGRGLAPFVTEVLNPLLPEGTPWTSLLEARDRANGIRDKVYARNDLQAMLRVVTERMGNLGYPFTDRLSREGQRLASELREVRNNWAHSADFSDEDTYRVLDSTIRLLRAVGAAEQAALAETLRSELHPPVAVVTPKPVPTPPGANATPTVTVETPDDPPTSATLGGAITIDLDTLPVLSYAAAHNGLTAVNSVTITNSGPAIRGAQLVLKVASALGVLSLASEIFVDLAGRDSVTLTDVALKLNAAEMLLVEERRPASVTASLNLAGEPLATTESQVELLAAHQWVRNPATLGLELLAAFVQPNAPEITSLLAEASDVLVAETGSGSLQGYQADENRVDEIVKAIFTAMQARKIRYSNPPASWGDEGQKVRTPAEVLDGRVGTCLDTTLVMAAAIEQAGLRPLIWLVDGHAFLGYWRQESSLGIAATSEPMDVVNLVDIGLIGLVETTFLTELEEPATFADAQRSPVTNWTSGEIDKILGVTDVVAAREAHIFPIPARSTNEDGTVTVVEYRPQASAERQYAEYEKQAPGSRDREVVPYRVAQWKNSLLDLSLRNRLINFTDAGRLALAVPDVDTPHVEDLINDGKALTMLPSDELSAVIQARGIKFGRDLPETDRTALIRDKAQVFVDVTSAAYTTRLRNLAYKARTIEEETGANNLYLAFGTLVWEFNGRVLRSPLILVPVKIEPARGGHYRVIHDESGTSTPNYCLLEKLKQTNNLLIPGLAEPIDDGSGVDLAAAFQATRAAVLEAGLPFRVESTVSLSILQFAKFRLWKDLDENWEELAQNSLVDHLINAPTQVYVDPHADSGAGEDLDELGALVPVPADSSQLSAIASAVANQTFVLEGPPGTGKSQTITNLLVRAVAEGKKVLFVAEKRAALEVVQRRLAEVGLAPFALDLHDKGSRPAAVRSQIKAALQHRVNSDEDGLRVARETLDGSRKTLARYAARLHEPNAAGLSFYTARTRYLALDEDLPTMEVPRGMLTSDADDRIEKLRRLFRNLSDVAEPARPRPENIWEMIDSVGGIDLPEVLKNFAEVDAAIAALPSTGPIRAALDQARTSADLKSLAGIAESPIADLATVDAAAQPSWENYKKKALAALDAFLADPREWMSGIDPTIVQLPLNLIHADALAADASRFFGRKKRRLTVRARIEPFVQPADLPKPRVLTSRTAQLAQLHDDILALRATFTALPGAEQPDEWNPLLERDSTRIAAQANWIGWLSKALNDPTSTPAIVSTRRSYFSERTEPDSVSKTEIVSLADAIAAADKALAQTSETAVEEWAGDQGLIPKWRDTIADRDVAGTGPATLAWWAELIEYVEPLREAGLDIARSEILHGILDPELAIGSFEKGLAAASLSERAASTTLDRFVANTHNNVVTRFSDSADDVRMKLVREIPAQLLSQRTFRADSSTGQIGELGRQLDRQRGGLGVRSLLDRFGPLIAELTPCMLMSPESVARFFGAKRNLFDIVVFDEASQVRVADAIGAMGRGRSVVVVGDSKQMPPTSFAESSAQLDDTDRTDLIAVQDEESILSECISAQVPSKALTWHYRSQDESLISFSNEHYYGNLSSFPSPLHGSSNDGITGHGISLVRVNGKFLRSATGKALRTNPVEAEAIVDEIRRRFWASPDDYPSLGVVTFNAPQRALVETLLRDSEDPRIVEALESKDEGLFVKNLENVQGDERDTILFSTAFSANENGALPLNFGPVGQVGGERRLNVAITRARRQVILFSSFDPQDLRAEDTTSQGLKDLKAYLQVAERGGAVPNSRFQETTSDRHREEIASALRAEGFAVTTDVGLSDFHIDLSVADGESPDAPLVAVLLDNPPWARRHTVADRDGLPVTVLKNLMNWPGVMRIWMPDWLEHRDAIVAAVIAEVERAKTDVGLSLMVVEVESVLETSTVFAERQPTAVSAAVQASPSAAVVGRVPDERFTPWTVRRAGGVGTLDRLPARDAVSDVQAVIREIVNVEAPIHVVRLAKLVGGAFGLDRVAQGRVESILRCVPSEFRVAGDKTYLWGAGADPATWTGFRRSEHADDRDFEHVHPREIINAMRSISAQAAGIYEDELRRETLNFFGLKRMTPKMVAVLDRALKQALDSAALYRSDDGLIRESEH
jgi:hypothetical protein